MVQPRTGVLYGLVLTPPFATIVNENGFWKSAVVFAVVVYAVVVFVFSVVVVVYLKRLRIVLRCAKAGCGRRPSSS